MSRFLGCLTSKSTGQHFLLVMILIIICTPMILIFYTPTPTLSISLPSNKYHPIPSEHTVKIVTVVCAEDTETENELRKINSPFNYNNVIPEAVTMMKSVLISCLLYNTPSVEFHLFVDSNRIKRVLEKNLDHFKHKLIDKNNNGKPLVNVTTYFYSVWKSVPTGYQDDFVLAKYSNNLRCTHIRLLFPSSLPSQVDKILYLDTDTIITGNISQVYHTPLCNDQAVGAAPVPQTMPLDKAILLEPPYGSPSMLTNGKLPHVPPLSVNAAVLLMNLTLLRETPWMKTIVMTYEKYVQGGVGLHDQDILNILLYYNLRRLKFLPCHYIFQEEHCENITNCPEAIADGQGIHIVHGAGDTFHRKDAFLYNIYDLYRKFNFSPDVLQIENHLLRPLRMSYVNNGNESDCSTVLRHALFKGILEK